MIDPAYQRAVDALKDVVKRPGVDSLDDIVAVLRGLADNLSETAAAVNWLAGEIAAKGDAPRRIVDFPTVGSA